jgi:hypothetical protein
VNASWLVHNCDEFSASTDSRGGKFEQGMSKVANILSTVHKAIGHWEGDAYSWKETQLPIFQDDRPEGRAVRWPFSLLNLAYAWMLKRSDPELYAEYRDTMDTIAAQNKFPFCPSEKVASVLALLVNTKTED